MRGHPHILIVSGVYPTPDRPHSGTFIRSQVESLIDAGAEVTVIHPPPGPVPVRYARAVLRVLLETTRRRYDVVHGHYGLWCLVARLQWSAPIVASFLGDDVLGTRTPAGDITPKSRVVAALSRGLARVVDAVIVKSEEMRRAIPSGNVHVIPNGVDFTLFHPIPQTEARAALGWDPDRRYVVFGNDPAIPVKNFPLARSAVDRLRERGTEVELVVATGLPQETLVLYLNAADALILSSMAEGSPNIVKEAMACNVPVVATDVGDVAQVIAHTAGCAVCCHSAADLADGLERALAHHGKTTGREDIRHLDRAVVAGRLLDLYAQIAPSRVVAPSEVEA